MPKALPEAVRDEVKVLFVAGFTPEHISKQKGVNPRTIHQWSRRHGWINLRDKLQGKVNKAVVATVTNGLQSQSDSIRARLASELERSTAALEKTPVRGANALANTPARQGRAAILKTLADTAATVFDWSAGSVSGLVLVGSFSQADPDNQIQPVVEVASTVTPEPAKS